MLENSKKEVRKDVLVETKEVVDGSKVVEIPNAEIKAAINRELGQEPEDDVTEEQLRGITKLELYLSDTVSETGMTNWEGTQYLINLSELKLQVGWNKKNLKDIPNFPNLLKLDINGDLCNLEGISNLSGISHLTIENVDSLQGMPNTFHNLVELYIYGTNNIQDFPKKLPSLKTLSLHKCNLTSLKGLLEEAPKLSNLELMGNQVRDLSGLPNSEKITWLRLDNNMITSLNELQGLGDFSNLEILFLTDNQLSDLSGLPKFSQLLEIYLARNNFTSFKNMQELAQLPVLYTISLNNNKLENLLGMPELPQGYMVPFRLYLESNNIKSFSAMEEISKISSLGVLDVTGNPLVNLNGIELVPSRLENLYLGIGVTEEDKQLLKNLGFALSSIIEGNEWILGRELWTRTVDIGNSDNNNSSGDKNEVNNGGNSNNGGAVGGGDIVVDGENSNNNSNNNTSSGGSSNGGAVSGGGIVVDGGNSNNNTSSGGNSNSGGTGGAVIGGGGVFIPSTPSTPTTEEKKPEVEDNNKEKQQEEAKKEEKKQEKKEQKKETTKPTKQTNKAITKAEKQVVNEAKITAKAKTLYIGDKNKKATKVSVKVKKGCKVVYTTTTKKLVSIDKKTGKVVAKKSGVAVIKAKIYNKHGKYIGTKTIKLTIKAQSKETKNNKK